MLGMQSLMQANTRVKPSADSLDDHALTEEEIITNYRKMCRHVRKGCNFDIQKCFIDGKPLIIEGSLLDPNCYIKHVDDRLEILTPDPENEEEAELENESVKKMRKTMQEIN